MGVSIETSKVSRSEFVGPNELRAKIISWKKENKGKPVILEIGSRSNNKDGRILQSSHADIEGEPLLVIHVDPRNEPTDIISGAERSSEALVVRNRFDEDMSRKIRGLVDMAVVVGLIPEQEVETEIVEAIRTLAPKYLYLASDKDSADRQRSGYTAERTKRTVISTLGKDYTREYPILPADIVPNSSIVTPGNRLTLIFERIVDRNQ